MNHYSRIVKQSQINKKLPHLFSPSNRLCFSPPSPVSPPANGDARPIPPNVEKEGRGEPMPVISVTRPVVGVCTSPPPKKLSVPERSSSDTSAPFFNEPKEEVVMLVTTEVLIREFDRE
jgi:hypothetical protein